MQTIISNPLNHEANALKDHFLVATEKLNGTVFEKALIYVREYNKEGTVGLIVNQALPELQFSDLFPELSHHFIKADQAHLPPIHYGGPVEHFKGFILHSADFQDARTLQVGKKVYITGTKELLLEIAKQKGPQHSLFILGYSAWGPKQIEKEIMQNCWMVAKMNEAILFSANDQDKWREALRASGIRPSKLSNENGHA